MRRPIRSLGRRGRVAIGLSSAVLVLAVVGVQVRYGARALPGTTVLGVDVGGLDESELRAALAAGRRAPVRIAIATESVATTVQRSGLDVDVEATIDRVLDDERGVLRDLPGTITGLLAGHDVDAALRVDERRLRRTLGLAAARGGRRADDGTLQVGADGVVSVSPSRPGRSVDRVALRRSLTQAVRQGRPDVQAPVRTLAPLTEESVTAAARAAERLLGEPFELGLDGRSVVLPRADLGRALMVVAAGEDRRQARLGVDRERLAKALRRIGGRFLRAAQEPRFSVGGSGVVLEDKGDIDWRPRAVAVDVTPGRPGRGLDVARTAAAVDRAVAQGVRRATVIRSPRRATVTTDSARRVRRLIGTFTTRFVAGQPRSQNIRRIARAVDGTVVAPGGTFSLNETSGARTAAKGYVEAPFIADGKIVPSVGGGVSQFSTTMYNAAYFAGLRLDAFRPHSLYIDRYPPGREATLNFPDIDLRWTNDTRVPVVVRTSSTASSVTVRLLGDNGGRRVGARHGTRQPAPGGNFAITVTRRLRYADGRVVSQPLTTRYETPA